jgi:hypothetical protein
MRTPLDVPPGNAPVSGHRVFTGRVDVTSLNDCDHPPRALGLVERVEPEAYQCPLCDWIGTEGEMGADAAGELWSNHICGGCGAWWPDLEYYAPVYPDA